MNHFDKRLTTILELGFDQSRIEKLKTYVELLWAANTDLNLFSRKMTFEELIDNHVIDCLLALKFFPPKILHAADFGSGGGLPGVIFAIHFQATNFILFEKSPKKREFLEQCRAIAPNLMVQGDIPSDPKGAELVTARAFKPTDVILDMSRDYYKRGGKYFLLKGRKEKIDEEILLAQKKFKNLKTEITPLTSPLLDVERHLVMINCNREAHH